MNRLKGWLLVLLLLAGIQATYITVPNTFEAKQLISSSKINANFDAFEDGLNDASKDLNVYRVYVSGQKVIDYNKDIKCGDLEATGNFLISGNVTCTGDFTITGDLSAANSSLSLATINATIVTGSGVVTTTTGSADANKVVRLNSVGHIDDDLLPFDVYNFYVKYPYAASSTIESIQEQFIYANGTIDSIKAELGTDATDANFIIDVLNESTTVNSTGQTYSFSDVDATVSVNSSLNNGVTCTSNNVIKLHIVQVGSTIVGQDLRVQVVIKRRD